jgi:YfiH family protein
MTLPDVPEPFYWTSQPWGAALRCRALDPAASHLFTTRQLPLSSREHWAALADAVGAPVVLSANQVHGNSVLVHRRGEALPQQRPDCDALVTDDAGVAVSVRAADCVPLLLADTRSGAVGAVHAGWRGTAARIASETLEAMGRAFGTRAADVVAAIGPSIGACCYEVGSELVDAFAAAGHDRMLIDRWFIAPPPPRGSRERPRLRLDVAGSNRDQLILGGVPEEQIHVSGLCTAMHLDVLTSYRAEKESAGRIAGVIRAHGRTGA